MTFDPYRTLGLTSDASLDEVKRAYRELAKRYHPDRAGKDETGHFLAIQEAYEALVHGRGRGPRGRSRPAWQADPDRARATREAYRARRGWAAGGGAGGSTPGAGADPWWRTHPPDGRAGGSSRAADGAARSAGGDATGTAGGAAGSTSGSTRRSTGPGSATGRSSGAPDDASSGPSGGADRSSAGGSAGAASRARPGGRGRRPLHRRKTTLTSTSYDEVKDPFEPHWQGSSWYGTSSGTFWTINPREYADPRKHGPEYQARARRAAHEAPGGPAVDDETEAPTTHPRHGAAAPAGGTSPGPNPDRHAPTGPTAPGTTAPGRTSGTTTGNASSATTAARATSGTTTANASSGTTMANASSGTSPGDRQPGTTTARPHAGATTGDPWTSTEGTRPGGRDARASASPRPAAGAPNDRAHSHPSQPGPSRGDAVHTGPSHEDANRADAPQADPRNVHRVAADPTLPRSSGAVGAAVLAGGIVAIPSLIVLLGAGPTADASLVVLALVAPLLVAIVAAALVFILAPGRR